MSFRHAQKSRRDDAEPKVIEALKKGSRAPDMLGVRIGRLVVVGRAKSLGKRARWTCLCECGAEKTYLASNLRDWTKRQRKYEPSCGCSHVPFYTQRACIVCRSEFRSAFRKRDNRYELCCSTACAGKYRDVSGSSNPRWIDSNGANCTVCGEGFRAYRTTARFCSVSCKNRAFDQGKTEQSRRDRNSKKTADWRNAVFARDDFTCQHCGTRGGKLNADHIKPWSRFPELRHDLSNGRTLCVPCHKKTPTFGRKALAA